MYPPEIVVLATSNVSIAKAQEVLSPALCTRILPIEEWKAPLKSIDRKLGKKDPLTRTLDSHSAEWTKLRIFSLQQYDTILYIDSDCLVLGDVSNLLELNKVYTESEALIAAAPDILPPNQFNSGVMVVRPSTQVFEAMQRHASLLTTYDGSDTGFLNAYFNTWFTEFPPQARLAVGYNAQQAMFDWTASDGSGSTFWDVQVASDLHIVHYSNFIKPWELAESASSKTTNSLQVLWKSWYQKSKNFLTRYHAERTKANQKQEEEEQQRKRKVPPPVIPVASNPNDPKTIQKLINKRYKQLRKEGKSTHEAMKQAQVELQPGEERDPRSQVAAMFGMM